MQQHGRAAPPLLMHKLLQQPLARHCTPMLLLRLLLLALFAPPAVSTRTSIPDFGSKPHIVMVVVDDLVRSKQ